MQRHTTCGQPNARGKEFTVNSLQRSGARLTVLALCAILASFPALARAQNSASPDASIRTLVEYRLAKKGLEKVRVEVRDHIVTLSGTTDSLAQKKAAAKAARLPEVEKVINKVVLAPIDRTDAAIAVDAQNVLDHYPFYGIFDWVSVHVQHGDVALNGSVYQPWHRDVLEERIADIRGVRSIENDVTVQPVSLTDDAIRMQAARALYSDFMFNEFAGALHPPIHIIVDNGTLTLDGVVRSRVEKQGAEAIVRTGTSALRVQDNLQVASEIPR
jgi:hyperosmotically inducible protein